MSVAELVRPAEDIVDTVPADEWGVVLLTSPAGLPLPAVVIVPPAAASYLVNLRPAVACPIGDAALLGILRETGVPGNLVGEIAEHLAMYDRLQATHGLEGRA